MTPLLWTKLYRDLARIWPRIVMMVVAMSVTLMVFSAVLYAWGVTRREMRRAYLGTGPASATLLLEQALPLERMAEIAARARRQPGIIDAAARTQLLLQVQEKGGGWGPDPLQVFVAPPEDQLRVEGFTVEEGSWPPPAGDILVERSSVPLLGAGVGDTLVIKGPDGQPKALHVAGLAYDPGLAPSFQEQKSHAFMSAASLADLGQPAAMDALKVQVADAPGGTVPSRDREHIVASAQALAAWAQKTFGIAIREIQVPEPYAHPHQRQADILVLALLVFGAAGLVLSAILVATMLQALFAQQIPQIGIMKALGAQSRQLFQLYLAMTLLIGALATCFAFAPGVFIHRAFSSAMLGLLGVKPISLAPPGWMYAATLACGLGVPVLFALFSLARSSATTVLEALNDRGVDPRTFAASRFDTWLGQVQSSNRAALMAFRNVFRRRGRLVLSVGLLSSAGAVFIAGTSTMESLQALQRQSQAQRRWDVEVELSAPTPVASATQAVAQVPHVMRVEVWTQEQTGAARPGQVSVTRTYPDQGHGSVGLVAMPADSTLAPAPPLLEGRWLDPGEETAVVLADKVRAESLPAAQTGDEIELWIERKPTRWKVVGIAQGGFGLHGGGIYLTQHGLSAVTGREDGNVLRIVTDAHDEATRAQVAEAAERGLAAAGIPVKLAQSVSRAEAAGAGHMLPLILIFLALSIAMGVVGLVGLASTMGANVLERIREFGVMRAIGASAAAVRAIVVAEGIFVAAASMLVALVPGALLGALLSTGMGKAFLLQPLPLRFSVAFLGAWAGALLVGAVLATLAPAARAACLTVREALTYL